MTEEEKLILKQTLIKESVGLLVLLGFVWYMGPGRILIGGLRRRVEIWQEAGSSAIDVEVQQFGNQVSRWDHEQAANAARKPGGQRGCGCG
jgi:hypothetical protein